MVAAGQRKIAVAQRDEITGNGLATLMEQLIERVLAIGSRFTPEYRTGPDADCFAVAVGLLAVALHFELLQVGWQQSERLAVGQDRQA